MQDLNDLYYFVQVVDHGGYASAGRALGIPRSKLSRRIIELEERLKTLQAMEEAEAQAENRKRREGDVTQIRRAYTYMGSRGSSRNEVRISKGDPEQTGYLKQIADWVARGGTIDARAAA